MKNFLFGILFLAVLLHDSKITKLGENFRGQDDNVTVLWERVSKLEKQQRLINERY